MRRLLKSTATSFLALTLFSTFLPSVAVVADELTEEPRMTQTSSINIDDIKIVEINKQTVQVHYPNGTIETVELRLDGVYLNGEFFSTYTNTNVTSFRSYDANRWNHVKTVYGNKLANSFSNSIADLGIGYLIGKLGAAIGPYGWLVGAAYTAINLYGAWQDSRAPYPYYISDIYLHLGNRQWKIVTRYYRNSNYTGYASTETNFYNF
ncbi:MULTISPECIES: hypothetical protein [unclassified Streptococcus]|uniref:hypothetical protein n=1 Tax=unclassified Streptococcus TaxID=2608887 RepID=UPI00359EE39D